MPPIAVAFDNIRLIRRKIEIAMADAAQSDHRLFRDAATADIKDLTEQLVRAIRDFADAGFEDQVAELIAQPTEMARSVPRTPRH